MAMKMHKRSFVRCTKGGANTYTRIRSLYKGQCKCVHKRLFAVQRAVQIRTHAFVYFKVASENKNTCVCSLCRALQILSFNRFAYVLSEVFLFSCLYFTPL
jgi:hypothetical protein